MNIYDCDKTVKNIDKNIKKFDVFKRKNKIKINKKGRNITGKVFSLSVLTLLILFASVCGIADFITPEKLTVFNINEINKNNFIIYSKSDNAIFDFLPQFKTLNLFDSTNFTDSINDKSHTVFNSGLTTINSKSLVNVLETNEKDEIYTANLFGIIPIKKVQINIFPQTALIPGGMPFGVKFFTEGVIVVGISDIETEKGAVNPAKNAGIKTSDIITEINGITVNSVEESANIIESSKGEVISLNIIRDGKHTELKLKPAYSATENKYKSGIWLRDSTAGIGTVTFITPANYAFGGLGHGICDVDTGNLMPLKKGMIVNAVIDNSIKGKPDAPGELKGKFRENMGTLLSNTQNGIFGILNNVPVSPENAVPLPIGLRSDVKEGKAVIYSTIDEKGTREFEIEIIKIYKNSSDSKNFMIKITDEELLEITGGIVQGMSGSPIIQNGKIIGAVTHVLVSDPTKGYGIFMENMFMSMPEILK